MDLSDKDKFSSDKGEDDHLNYHSATMSPSWQFGAANLTDQPMGLLSMNNLVDTCGDAIVASNGPSVSMVDSFGSNLWGNPNSQNLGLGGSHIHASTSIGNPILGSSGAGSDKILDLDWSLRNSIPKEGVFLPQTFSQFPADPAFIERAARFSCFTGGTFSNMVNPFSISESMNHQFKGEKTVQRSPEVVMDDGLNLNPSSGAQSPLNDPNMTQSANYVPVLLERGATEGSPIEKLRRMGSFVRLPNEEKSEIGVSSNESYEAEVSGSRGQCDPSVLENASGEPSSSKGLGMKKRKRSGQDTENTKGETAKDSSETKQKTDEHPTSNAKASKHGKNNSRNTDVPKEDYIHVRARRGQATNSHSLAERVRREKISERMKFLQDLVPGCSKVTGKAVMLDEIINYVQSLQRQVEFLSMKLAAVNPRLELNTEVLLAKDVLQSRGGLSTFPFSPDTRMVHPQLHPSQQELIQPIIPGTENPSDALRRTINSQLMAMNGGYKGPTQIIPHMWDDELNTVLHFGNNSAFNGQDSNASHPSDHMKDEL